MRWFVVLVAICLSVLLQARGDEVKWTACSGHQTDVFVIEHVDVTPLQPAMGHNLTFTILGRSGDDVLSGQVTTKIYWEGALVETEVIDICTISHCPIKKGALKIAKNSRLRAFRHPVRATAYRPARCTLTSDIAGKVLVPGTLARSK